MYEVLIDSSAKRFIGVMGIGNTRSYKYSLLQILALTNTRSYKYSLLHLLQMLNSGGGIWKDMKPEVGGPTAWNVDIFVQVLKELVRI